jgi:hypothetical protein
MRMDSSAQLSQADGSSSGGKTAALQPFSEETKDSCGLENQMLTVLHVFDIDRCRTARFYAGMWWEEG